MQTPKAKPGSLEVPQRKSPATPRNARQPKNAGSESNSVSSPNPAGRTPKEGSPKVAERRSPRSPITEKKRPSKVSELESKVAQLEEDLRKAKDQLNTSELSKRKAMQEAEDARMQLSTVSSKLEQSQQRMMELSASEDARIEELRKISNDRDRAWESELEAVQKQHSIDSTALASALNEIQKLKSQLEIVMESEASQTKQAESAHSELQSLRVKLTETFSLVEKLKAELIRSRESEARALEMASKAEKQLETANGTAEMLQADAVREVESHKALLVELDKSKAQVNSLEELVSQLQGDLAKAKSLYLVVNPELSKKGEECEETSKLKAEVNDLKFEVDQLQSALEASETQYQEEYIQSTMQIRSAYEEVEKTKQESGEKVVELEAELKKARTNIAELKATLLDKETELQGVVEENKGLTSKVEQNQHNERESEREIELKKLEHDISELKVVELEAELKKARTNIAELKATLLDKETELQGIVEENKGLTSKVEQNQVNERESEREMELKKLEHDISELKASLLDKERQLQNLMEQNEMLQEEIRKEEMQSNKLKNDAAELVEAARAAEREALMKLGYVTEEADKSNRRAARVTEQLDAVQAASTEMEAELRRLKVQSDQWRKAAEAAAAMLSSGNNGKLVERTGSLDSHYNPGSGITGSPYVGELDDDSPKKKNGSVLKKIGVLWKKGQK